MRLAALKQRDPKLHLRAVSFVGTDVLSPVATGARELGAEYVEALASHIIEQALKLRENAPLKNMKRKAFAGLLKRLKTIGLRGAFAAESALPLSRCLAASVPGPQLGVVGVECETEAAAPTAEHATAASTTELGSEAWARADAYFHRTNLLQFLAQCVFRCCLYIS